MSLIITNKTNLKDIAIIVLSNKNTNLVEKTDGDLTIIKSGDEVVGINIFNYSKYFEAKDGAHTVTDIQIDEVAKLGYKIENPDSKFSIGKVIEKTVHPKSDKLFLLKVLTDKELQIVTNAANAEVGKNVVVANVGATLPSGTPIVLSKLMGIESQGMLCGGETLGKEPTNGILLIEGTPGEKFIL